MSGEEASATASLPFNASPAALISTTERATLEHAPGHQMYPKNALCTKGENKPPSAFDYAQ